MFEPRAAPWRCCRCIGLIFIGGLLLSLLSGCSSIDDFQKKHNVMATLAEADRQFSIESTPDDRLPNDTAAKKWIASAIGLMPHSDYVYLGDEDDGLITLLEARGRYPMLIDYLKKAIKDPKLANDSDLLVALADAEERMGPQSEATKTYAAALTAINSSMSSPGSTLSDKLLLYRARAEYYGGQRARAIKDFNSIIVSRPDLASEAENDLAYFYSLDKSDLKDAKILASHAVADARRDGDDDITGQYVDTLAWVDYQSGDVADALLYEQEAASLIPLQPDIQYHLGEICRSEGQNFEAKIAYRRAIKLDPFFPEARASLQSLPPTSDS